jgi:DMSO/TMAO reductase YedYZ molybdopterin-dependent catalytic subunit
MNKSTISRRTFLAQSGAALAGLALFKASPMGRVFAQGTSETVMPWMDQRVENPVPHVIGKQQTWEKLDSWITPNDQFFSIAHYGQPEIDVGAWQLEISGLVGQPLTLTYDDIMSRPRQEFTFTLECSGNTGLPFFDSGIGNAVWAGTPLAPLLEEAGVLEDGREVVFFGTDVGPEPAGEEVVMQNFARGMSLEDAMNPMNILCYEMNGEPLPVANGFPLRLIAPGWYGIANIKWLERIEVWDSRLANHWMAEEYVTVRNIGTEEEPEWTKKWVGRTLLKSAPGRVIQTDTGYRIDGAAWGAPISAVEVQIDGGDWMPATLDTSQQADYSWIFWSIDADDLTPGEHSITSRAIDTDGNVQPAPDDPYMMGKITYWESNGQITRYVEIPE